MVGSNDCRNVAVLINPGNDASDVAAPLTRLGFDVQPIRNGTLETMRRVLREFGRRARSAVAAICLLCRPRQQS